MHVLGVFTCAGVSVCLGTSGFGQQPYSFEFAIPAPLGAVQNEAGFGSSVAIDGDYAVVGAPYVVGAERSSGAATVFHSITGERIQLLDNPDPDLEDRFGAAVAISGSRVIVGCLYDDTDGSNAGSAYLYDLESAFPNRPLFRFKQPHASANRYFGSSLFAGDLAIIAAPGNSSEFGAGGSIFVYDLNSTTPAVPTRTFRNPLSYWDGSFGFSLAVSGNLLAVGAPKNDEAGAVYVYDLEAENVSDPVAILNNPWPGWNDNFGVAVAISGTRVAVGANYDAIGEFSAGAVHVFELSGGSPQTPTLSLWGPQVHDNPSFGEAICLSGSLLAVGTPRMRTESGYAPGEVSVYDLDRASAKIPIVKLAKPEVERWDWQFGSSLAISGQILVVGAPALDGEAYTYHLSGGALAPLVATLENASPIDSDRFGHSAAMSEARLLVGAWGFKGDFEHSGIAYLFDLNHDTPAQPAAVLRNPNPRQGDQFGYAVGMSGTRGIIGAPGGFSGGWPQSGMAFVFDMQSDQQPMAVVTIPNPTPDLEDRFGSSVALSGSWAAVGAPRDDGYMVDSGMVHIYDVASASPATPLFSIHYPFVGEYTYFGTAVDFAGELLAVGAPLTSRPGAVFIYDLTGGPPADPVRTIRNPEPVRTENFGESVSIDGKLVAIGAPRNDHGAEDAGSVYVFDLDQGEEPALIATLRNPYPAEEDRFGGSVRLHGTRVAVGVPGSDRGAVDCGTAFLYALDSDTPEVPVAELSKPVPRTGDSFGAVVALEGTTVAVGAPGDSTQALAKGAAYVFGPHTGVEAAMEIEQPAGVLIEDYQDPVQFEPQRVASLGQARRFTVRNIGNANLAIFQLSISGEHDTDFLLDHRGFRTGIEPGSSTEFSIAIVPCDLGPRSATLQIYSNDRDQALIKIPLQGEGVTATSPFEDALTAAGLTGERASPTAKPYHDGIENLLKFAFNMDLTGPISHALMPAGGTSGLPLISLEQNGLVYFLRFEFVRRTGSGLSYMPQTSEELNSASWIPLNATPQISQIDASWERVVYEEEITVSNSPMLFGRVVVSMP